MSAEKLITDHIDIWTSAVQAKSSSGRGSSKKRELYGIKKLRELILELAVRGKLVPQDPNDEPASVLLERIAAEKAQLVKEKKIKKLKALPTIDSVSVPNFELPTGWTWAFMPQVVAHNSYAIKRGPFGSALKKSFFVQSGFKVYEQQHAINDDFYRGDYFIDDEKFEELKAFEVKPFDLIISCSGTVGKVAIAPEDMAPGIINQALLKISLNTSALTNEYFKILFGAYFMATETLSDLQGTAQKNMVSVDTLKSEPFPYPPLSEQHRIVAKVDELMALCDQLEQQTEASLDAHQVLVETLLATLTNSQDATELMASWTRISEHFDTLFTTEESIDQLKQTILQLAVMGKLVPQDPNDEPAAKLLERIAEEKAQLVKEKKIKKQKALPPIAEDEKPFELPVGWEWCRLDDICQGITSGSTPPKSNFQELPGIPYLKVYNIRNQLIDFEYNPQFIDIECHSSKLARSVLYPGDVVMNIVGPPLGKIALIPDSYPEWNCNQAITFFRPIEPSLNRYIYTYLTAGTFLDSIELIGTAGQDNISVTKSRSIVLPTPPLEEQSRIVRKVNDLLKICDQLKQRLRDSQQTQLQLTDAIVEQAV
ncbi:restriction endonuclease subunit S [Vibrio vulnificus]|uniref:restriction endonuclease subunit S n=1 Tax=Vibrio vulnificus TaxID=672 RepID=UPI000CD2C8DC|nr:restriction endonuclease subunit S [Vibrio vulnificus]EGQ7954344.1 restriction endonuclease subunit S [Vibrio vulnificus]EGQ7988342.1 restriction endonuclease subunit S [Vibrio vulnificus]EGQ9237869.1 restriction endonuclease subunit S [Vibrio vulnificus]EGR7960189.1 restriction endonuclease subunit S [Vibrio vulnificus]EGR7983658.1 restriction endonuclease subunit S [Vibrio vulnificus]